jgi:hypothetical protein
MILYNQPETRVFEKRFASRSRLEIVIVDRDKDAKVSMVLVGNRLECLVDMIDTTKCGHSYKDARLRHIMKRF